MSWIRSRGALKAFGGNRFTKSHKSWMILSCHPSIMTFYFDQIKQQGLNVSTPLAGSHISVIRQERIQDWDCWRSLLGQRVNFLYEPMVRTNGKHYWLRVKSPQLETKRLSLGLSPQPYVPFHLTVATKTENEGIQPKPMTKEVLAEVKPLRNMRDAVSPWVWEISPERIKLESFESRYYE